MTTQHEISKLASVLSRSTSSGFTLIEVLFALAILAIALLGFHQGQSNSVRMTLQSERKLQAMELAQMKMTEVETEIKKKGFQGMSEDDKGEFKDERFKEYKWTRKLEKTDIGCFIPQTPKKDAAGNIVQKNEGAFGIFKQVLDSAVRKIKVTVEWQDGKRKQNVTISQLSVRFEDLPSPP